MIEISSTRKTLYLDIFIFSAVFLIVGLAFPFSSPDSFYLNFPNSHNVFNKKTYFVLSFFLLISILAKVKFSYIAPSFLFYWVGYFVLVVAAMLFSGHTRLSIGVLYLLLFVAPLAISASRVAIFVAVGAALSANALYSIAGILAVELELGYAGFPIIPYIYDGNVKLGPGFYKAFSPALFLQTNAAGAIFGTAFCFFLYQLISDRFRSKFLFLVTFICMFGLLLTRSLSPLLLIGLLCVCILRGRALAILLIGTALYMGFVFIMPGGIFGLNAAYLQHKIDSSAFVKLSLLSSNLSQMMGDGVLALIVPGREPPLGTENSFIDMAYQFGLVQIILFYGWCAMTLRIFEDRYRILFLFPILLSFFQNSAFTTPSVVIFGVALAIYGNNANPSGEAKDVTSLSPNAVARL